MSFLRSAAVGVFAIAAAASAAHAQSVVQLSTGLATSCALFDNGKVKCWGANASGQLGLGDVNPRGDTPGEMGAALPYVNFGANLRAVFIASGRTHNCVILESGGVKCWGANARGQLGLGNTSVRGSSAGTMGDALPMVSLGTGRRAVSLALGGEHTCALLDNSAVKCWGFNDKGQLGLGDTRNRGIASTDMGDALPAINLGADRVPLAITAAEKFSCALLRGGEVICWGENVAGQLGRETTVDVGAQASPLVGLPTINLGLGLRGTRMAAGENFNCVLTNTQALKCFGQNADGRLGVGDTTPRGTMPGSMGDALPTILLEPGLAARDIACGKSGCCAIINLSGALKCFGANEEGQLGLEDRVARGSAPNQLGLALPFVELGRLSRVAQVSLGSTHACVLLESGSVKCWGKNDLGQLGIGSRNSVGDLPGSMGEALVDVAL